MEWPSLVKTRARPSAPSAIRLAIWPEGNAEAGASKILYDTGNVGREVDRTKIEYDITQTKLAQGVLPGEEPYEMKPYRAQCIPTVPEKTMSVNRRRWTKARNPEDTTCRRTGRRQGCSSVRSMRRW